MNEGIAYIRKELAGLYPKEEIESLVFLVLEHVKGYTRTQIRLAGNEQLSTEEHAQIRAIVSRLQAHEPIQYILGETEFLGLPFFCAPEVLIPRPETEELVDRIIRDFSGTRPAILDIGTGTGCIPVSLAKNLPGSAVFACDISPVCLQLAEKNAARNSAEIHLFKLDILHPDNCPELPLLDVLVSNPPYVTEREKAWMHPNVLNYEPSLALFVPDNEPLRFYLAISRFGRNHLKKGGKLYFEINEAFGAETCRMLEQEGFSDAIVLKDINGKDRMVRATFQ